MSIPNYIVVQAGGKGTRLKNLTKNKPKALVPVDNLPMIFHLFRKFPDRKFIVIGDYKYDVLEKYMKAFAQVEYTLVCATGFTGTCAGLQQALACVPENQSFLLIWCDLVLPGDFKLPENDGNTIVCRWKYENGEFSEEKSAEHGVAGYFIFQNKKILEGIPQNGEFVRWLRERTIAFKEQDLYRTHEYGIYEEWDKLPKMQCRPFNRVWVEKGRFYKEGIDVQGVRLAAREKTWYQKLQGRNFKNIPIIYGYDPLCMEQIKGKNIYEYKDISNKQKKEILGQIVQCLKQVHTLETVPADRNSFYEAYIGKTFNRLEKIRELVPFANDATVTVNGRVCRNIFFHREEVEALIMQYLPKTFSLIHGDCTFSNIMLREDGSPVLIDPRGYFGNTKLYGDIAYDWVKIYYSLVSNYDQFNQKRFRLDIGENGVWLEIDSNSWEELEDEFFDLVGDDVTKRQMKLYLSIIWLSLTTYAWEDYDSVCGAFYNGLYYLEDALSMDSAYHYFEKNSLIIEDALKSISLSQMEGLISQCQNTLESGHRIIASGLGKNVPICDKFVGTMLSLGLNAGFLHTNSAVHGDLGMVHNGDLVILLTKSDATSESVYLAKLLLKREGVKLWLLSFENSSILTEMIENKLIIHLEHEGDLWNTMPNNSTTLNLIVLQTVAIELSRRMNLSLEQDFAPNHPGGAIGTRLAEQSEKNNEKGKRLL